MPTIELDDFPYYHLDTILEKLQTLLKTIGTDNMTRDVVAVTLSMSASGGAFTNLISSMDKFGFVETAYGGKITVTDLGKEAIYGEQDEVKKAQIKAFFNVRLFKEVYDRYGYDATEEQMRAFLRQEANVDIVKAQSRAQQAYRIFRGFLDTVDPLIFSSHYTLEDKHEVPKILETPTIDNKQDSNDFIIQHGRLYIRIPQDDLVSIKLAKQSIELYEEIVRKKMEENVQKT